MKRKHPSRIIRPPPETARAARPKIESKQELHRLNANKRRLLRTLCLCGGINMLICIPLAALRALCNFNTF